MKKIAPFFVLLIVLFNTGCEKESSGTGKHILLISNYRNISYSLGVYIDDKFQGSVVAIANTSTNATCDAVSNGFSEDNMFVSTYVSKGTHTLTIKNWSNGNTMSTGTFTLNGDCITQRFELN